MISSRKLSDLDNDTRKAADAALADCDAAGLDVLIYCTYRDFEAQADLYASGRTEPGKWKTKAKAGQSWHNWRCALDLVPLRHGKPIWGATGNGIDADPTDDERDDLELWQKVATIFKAHGFEWGGDWPRARDFPHFQRPDGQSLNLMLARFPKGLP